MTTENTQVEQANQSNQQMKECLLDKFLPVKIRNYMFQEFIRNNNYLRSLDFETQYALSLIQLLDIGTKSEDRTGVGTTRLQSQSIHIDMTHNEFPALRGKKVSPEGAFTEIMWIMMGRSDLQFLKDNGVNYWDEWVKEDGTFGPIYGSQMRNFNGKYFAEGGDYGIFSNVNNGIDQLCNNINELITNPDSRRIITSLWNPSDLRKQALPCCHYLYHLTSYIDNGKRFIDLHITQRSADSFLGVPYDFMLFAYYLKIISMFTGHHLGQIHLTMSDYHAYNNHTDQIKQYLSNVFDDPNDKMEKGFLSVDNESVFVFPDNAEYETICEELAKFRENRGNFDSLTIDKYLQKIFDKKLLLPTNYNSHNHYPMIKASVAV